jgi:hypothetical protein
VIVCGGECRRRGCARWRTAPGRCCRSLVQCPDTNSVMVSALLFGGMLPPLLLRSTLPPSASPSSTMLSIPYSHPPSLETPSMIATAPLLGSETKNDALLSRWCNATLRGAPNAATTKQLLLRYLDLHTKTKKRNSGVGTVRAHDIALHSIPIEAGKFHNGRTSGRAGA